MSLDFGLELLNLTGLQVHPQKDSAQQVIEEGGDEEGRQGEGVHEKLVGDIQIKERKAEFDEGQVEEVEGGGEGWRGERETKLGEEKSEMGGVGLEKGETFGV